MIFTGRITNVGTLQSGVGKTDKPWASIEVVVEDEEQYPNTAVFKLFKNGDNVKYAESFTNDYPIGTLVEVEFNLKAKEFKGKYYQELSIWKIKKVDSGVSVNETKKDESPVIIEDDSDLPF